MQFSPRTTPPRHPSQLHAAIERWQQFVLSTDEFQGASVFREARQLVHKMPRAVSFAEEMVAKAVIIEILCRLVEQAKLCGDPKTGSALVRLAGSLRSDAWMEGALAFLDGCADIVEVHEEARAMPPLVRRALRELDARYRDPHFDETSFAEGLGKSVSYIAHLLTAHTGRSFLQHVHARRTGEAFRQLIHMSGSVEEIAIAVGYAGTTQLRRHLRQRYGLTAREIRAGKTGRP